MPPSIEEYRYKLFGLSIDPERLAQIRQERFTTGRYAQLKQCKYEVSQAEAMFRQQNIPYVNTTSKSIQELATTII